MRNTKIYNMMINVNDDKNKDIISKRIDIIVVIVRHHDSS